MTAPNPVVHSHRESALKIERILVPVEDAVAPRHLVREAAWLARRFQAEIILLHAADEMPEPELFDGLTVTRLLLQGDMADGIIETARELEASLVMMSAAGYATRPTLRECYCPVWTGNGVETEGAEFSIRRVLCSIDLSNEHARFTLAAAAQWAASLGAVLTLAHITTSVEKWGPGGSLVDKPWRDELVGNAASQIAALQLEAGTNAEVVIDSGDVAELLNLTAVQSRADLLIVGHLHGRSHLGNNDNGVGIISVSTVPVLSV
jgi:nucleotide-binding universal stress UspA family protein